MRNYRLHLIRHGLTQGNREGRYIGRRTDSELCPEGIKELIDLRELYEYPPVGVVYASPLTRCIQTAGIVYPGRELMVHDGLAETDFGEFDGKTMSELAGREDFVRWLGHSATMPPPGGESPEDLMVRVARALDEILGHMAKEEIYDAAVVTHGGVIGMILGFMALPKLPVKDRLVGSGRGYTCYANLQLWRRDNILEVAGIMPHGAADVGNMNSEAIREMEKLAGEWDVDGEGTQ